MKSLFFVLSLVFLSGCATKVPVFMKFPDVPQELLNNCDDLKHAASDEQKLSELMKIVIDNYGSYHTCRVKLESWIDWYNAQKEIAESLNKK
jgi:hypothetical protein